MEDPASAGTLLKNAVPGDYLVIMAYIPQTPEVDLALDALRRRVTETYGIATTIGYGPRFLHSTGQLHKGGPGPGLFLQITAEHSRDLNIPGTPFTFGVLVDAQAVGDLQALRAAGRRSVRVDVGASPEQGIKNITGELA